MRRYILLLPLFLFLALPAQGISLEETVDYPQLERASRAYLDEYLGLDDAENGAAGAQAILEGGLGRLPGLLRQAGGSVMALVGVAMLCGLAESIREELGGGGLSPVCLAGAVAVATIAVAQVNSLMGLGRETLGQMETFSRLLMPVVTAACAATGAPVSAAARQSLVLFFLSLLVSLAERLIAPLIYAYVATATAHAALENEGLGRLAALLRRGASALMTGFFTAFVALLAVSGALSGSADAMTQKAAKAALSSFVPVVGGILSDAAEAVAAGAGALRSTVGVLGLLTVLAICILPFLRLGVHYLLYKLSAALCATVCPGPVAALVDDIGSAFALLMGLVGGGGFILYVALITSVKAVTG